MRTEINKVDLVKVFEVELMMATVGSTVCCKYCIFLCFNRFLIKSYVLITSFRPLRSVRVEVTFEAAETETMILSLGLFKSCYSI